MSLTPKTRQRLVLLVILLLAVVLRFWELPQLPRGIAHDEVAEVLIARDILKGHHALFFQEAYGQEPLFLYLVAGAMGILGENVLALRFVSASIGLLTVAAGARLARRLFDSPVALITAAGLGVMLWPVFWSRVGLRGMTLPLTMCLGFESLWCALHTPSHSSENKPLKRQPSLKLGALHFLKCVAPHSRYRWCSRPYGNSPGYALLSGFWFGLSAYTYLASRGLPILLGAFLLYLLLFERSLLCKNWQSFALSFGLAALIALPLVAYLWQNPALQYRVYEVNLPLAALRQGDLRPVMENSLRVLGMFSLQGDFTVRNNFPYRPVFPGLLWGAFFYTGLLVSLRHLREPRYGLLLLWLVVMLSPSIVTTEAPNFVRTLGALPVVMLLPGIGVSWLGQQFRDWHSQLSRLLWVLLGLMIVAHTGLTIRDYFVRWPSLEETQFVWQEDLLSVAQYLDVAQDWDSVTVAGLSNTSMDAPTLDLLLRRQDLKIRWIDTGSPLGAGGAIVVPAGGGPLLIPAIVPLNPLLAGYLDVLGHKPEPMGRFTRYLLPPYGSSYHTDVPFLYKPSAALNFESGVALLSVTQLSGSLKPGEPLDLLSTWQVLDMPSTPLKVFVHLLDAGGNLLAQHDGLDSPVQFWQPGDVIIQTHTVSIPLDLASGPYALRLGLYNPDTLVPYRLLDGRDFVDLGRLMIEDGN